MNVLKYIVNPNSYNESLLNISGYSFSLIFVKKKVKSILYIFIIRLNLIIVFIFGRLQSETVVIYFLSIQY